MTDTHMVDALPEKLRSTRGWLVGAVVATGAAAWLAVAWAVNTTGHYSGYLGVVGISVTLGSAEVAYLAWRNWTHGERGLSGTVTAVTLTAMIIMVGLAYFASVLWAAVP